MEHKRKKLSGSANRKLKEEKEARQKALLEKMPTLTNFFKKGETLSMDITEDEQHKEGKEKNQQQYDNNAQQSNVKEKEEDQKQQNMEQPQPEDQEREYLDEDELSNMLSVNYTDPALWGRLSEDKIIDIMKNISNVEVDIQELDFSASKVVYKSQSRYATKMIFYRRLQNGKQQKRNWLLYSNTSGKVYCIPCKLFGSANNPFSAGFNDWKHSEKISDHENSALHKENTRIIVNRSTEKWEYFKNYSIISMEKNTNYWKNILERIIEVIKFLSSRGLAFRGENQTIGDKHNGNYLGCLELLAKFDPILQQHIFNFANKGTGNISYLSANICDEFLKILGRNVRCFIITELKEAKYYSIIVDSTPDISHMDQLTIVVRYVNKNGTPVERFLKFLENTGHKSSEMQDCILKLLSDLDISLEDCRGQSYDNASNMSGIYNGLQARIKSRNNLAIYVPCAAHSLNLIGQSAAECCIQATKLFLFLQNLYNFFAASTSRWEILKNTLTAKNKVPKKLSDTRWSARADSVKVVVSGYENFKNALTKLYEDNFQKPATKVEAQGLLNEFNSLETAIMIAFWSEILETIDKTNISLQKVDITIECIVSLYASLEKFVQSKRNIDSFNLYKSEGIKLSGCYEYKRLRKRKRQFDENTSEEVQLDANDEFRIKTYYAIIDKILAEVQKRKCAYVDIYSTFGFLVNLKNINEDIIRNNAAKLCEIYQNDLENNFIEECLHFKHVNLLENTENISIAELSLKTIIELKIESTFPNVTTALRIFLSIATTNCSGERSFSAIKRIKNYLRSSLGQSKLNDLSILSIERDLFENLNTSDIIDQFAKEKARKVNI